MSRQVFALNVYALNVYALNFHALNFHVLHGPLIADRPGRATE